MKHFMLLFFVMKNLAFFERSETNFDAVGGDEEIHIPHPLVFRLQLIIPALRGDYGCPPGKSKDVRERKEKDCDNIAKMRYVNCGAGYVF